MTQFFFLSPFHDRRGKLYKTWSAIRLKRILIFRTKVWWCSLSLTIFPETFLSPLITQSHAPGWNYKYSSNTFDEAYFSYKNVDSSRCFCCTNISGSFNEFHILRLSLVRSVTDGIVSDGKYNESYLGERKEYTDVYEETVENNTLNILKKWYYGSTLAS